MQGKRRTRKPRVGDWETNPAKATLMATRDLDHKIKGEAEKSLTRDQLLNQRIARLERLLRAKGVIE